MDEIRDLIKIVTEHTKKNVPLIELRAQEDNDNKEMKLFLGLREGEYTTDENASMGIYGTEEVDFKFRMLKSRLNRKLLNHLFFVDIAPPKAHKSVSVHQECLDYLHFARMLLKIDEIKWASRLLHKALEQSRQNEFTDIEMATLKEMRDVFASTYRPKLFTNLRDEIKACTLKLRAEEDADEIYYDNKLILCSTINNRKKELKPVKNAVDKLEKLAAKTSSYNIFINYAKLKIRYHELAGEFDNALRFIKQLEQDYNDGKINVERFDIDRLHYSRIYSLYRSGRLEEGKVVAGGYMETLDPDTSNWFKFMELYFLISVHIRDYNLAVDLYLQYSSNKATSKLDESTLHKWNVFRSYLFFLTGDKRLIKKFDYNEFLNDMPEYSKEFSDINVALLILQALHKVDGDITELAQILDNINEYVSVHLNNSFSKRTKVLVKLLQKVSDHEKDYETIMHKSKYLVEKLYTSQPSGDIYHELEIVPYEHLWEMLVRKLSLLRYQRI